MIPLTPESAEAWFGAFCAMGVALAGAVAVARKKWIESKPVAAAEKQQIASLETSVAVKLTEATKDDHYGRIVTVLEKLLNARDKEHAALMVVNRRNGELHAAAIEKFRAEQAVDRNTIADLREDVAEFKGHNELCEGRLEALQQSVAAMEASAEAAQRAAHNRYHALARKYQEKGGSFSLSDIEGFGLAMPR